MDRVCFLGAWGQEHMVSLCGMVQDAASLSQFVIELLLSQF